MFPETQKTQIWNSVCRSTAGVSNSILSRATFELKNVYAGRIRIKIHGKTNKSYKLSRIID